MARKLTTAQKKLLDQSQANSVDDLSAKVFDQVERLNDYETLYQDVNRYLMDRFFEKRNKEWTL